MNRLSAIDAFGPAFARSARDAVSSVPPGRLVEDRTDRPSWRRYGWSPAAVCNFRAPVIPGNVPHGGLPPDAEDIFRAIRSIHLADYFHVFVIVIAVIAVLALIFLYLFCRFRFILFDSVVTRQPDIGRGWRKYESPGQSLFRVLAGVPAGHLGSTGPDCGFAAVEGIQKRPFQW